MKASLKQRIMVPLFLGLFILLAVFSALLYLSQQRYLSEAREKDRESVLRFFNARLNDDAAELQAALARVQRDPRLLALYWRGNRYELQRASRSIFEELKTKSGVTAMNFITPDRVA